jgi:hypothetical protein
MLRVVAFTAVTMKNVVFWDIRIPLRVVAFTAVTMKNAAFWDIRIVFVLSSVLGFALTPVCFHADTSLSQFSR